MKFAYYTIFSMILFFGDLMVSQSLCSPNPARLIFDSTITVGKAEYKIITHLRLIELEQQGELLFNGNESIFTYGKGKEGFVNQNILNKTVAENAPIQDGWYQDETGNIYYKNFKKDQLIIREIVWQQPYLTSEPFIPRINWQIQNQLKMIGKFTCQKAEADFRGRHYEAWFTTEIPVSDGPWKFQGLPGLILEARDDKNEVRFDLISVEIPYKTHDIKPPSNGKKITFADYKRADEIEFQKARKKFLSQNQDRESSAEFNRVNKNLIEKF